jgi:hypothetical protein
MATGESITPSTDITMRTTAASQPAIGASIDPTNYYGQSFVYDEWVKSKVKELNQNAKLSEEEQSFKNLAIQHETYQDIAKQKESEFKEQMDELNPVIQSKTAKFKNDNYAAIDPVGYWKQEQAKSDIFNQEQKVAMAKIMKDPVVRGILGYSDDGRVYGSMDITSVLPFIKQKYPELAKYWPTTSPNYMPSGVAYGFYGVGNAGKDERERPLSMPNTSIGAQAGDTTTPSGQLETYNRNVFMQQRAVTDAIDQMKKSTSQDQFDTAKKQYDNAIQSLKDASKQDISKITTWTDVKYAQGYGEGGKLSAANYGELANQKYNLEQSINNQVNSSQALNSALKNITDSGGRINAEQLQDLGNMRNQVVSQVGELNLVKAQMKYIDAVNAWRNNPNEENKNAAKELSKNMNFIAYQNSLTSQNPGSNYLQNISGVNVIGKSDNLGTLDVNPIGGKYRSGLDFGDNKIELAPIVPYVGSIITKGPMGDVKSDIVGTSKGEVVRGIQSDINPSGIMKLSDVTDLFHKFNKTDEYNIPYGSIYQSGRILGIKPDEYANEGFGGLKFNVIEDKNQGTKMANDESESAGIRLQGILGSGFINPLLSAPVVGHTTGVNLPIVRSNMGEEFVIPKSGSPIKLSDFNVLSPNDKKDMAKTPVDLLLPNGGPRSQIDIINESVKYGGPSLTNLKMISQRLDKVDPEIFKTLTLVKSQSLISDNDYKNSINILGKGLATGNYNNSDIKMLSDINKNINLNYKNYNDNLERSTGISKVPVSNPNVDIFGQSNMFDTSKGQSKVIPIPKVNTNVVNATITYGTPSKTDLSGVLISNKSLSNSKPTTSKWDFGNLFGSKKKKDEEVVARKSKKSQPKIDMKKKSKNIINIDTKVKSEFPAINIPDLKFIRGKVANNKVGVIDTEIIKVNNMFKIPKISIKKKKVK